MSIQRKNDFGMLTIIATPVNPIWGEVRGASRMALSAFEGWRWQKFADG
jgi:hypothetical protein